jgi:hypothetical protein
MSRSGIKGRQNGAPLKITRRQLLAGVGAATIAGSLGAIGRASPVSAVELRRARPVPSPIPGGVDAGEPVGLIHWFLPGVEGTATPFAGLPGMGLDVEPSTLTDFQGYTAYAVISGQAEGSDGKIYNVEFDVRVMEGDYIAEDGSAQNGVFGFF